MGTLRNLWAGRPFWTTKLGQLTRLVYESHARPIAGTQQPFVAAQPGELAATFLGHSSFLIQAGGQTLLIDPVFATRLILLRRQRRPGIHPRNLPPLDAILLTHAHMDHLDRPTLRKLVRRTRKQTGQAPIAIIPQGVEDLVADLGFRHVRTLEWWQQTQLAELNITFTPARHWGARMFKDTHRLFGGYVLSTPQGQTLYHAGDTAYFPGFHEIGRRLHPQVALLPIGAYHPGSYSAVHTNPEEAVQAFRDLGAEVMIPMHFGTFRLGREPMHEPPIRLRAEAERLGIQDHVHILTEGQTYTQPTTPKL